MTGNIAIWTTEQPNNSCPHCHFSSETSCSCPQNYEQDISPTECAPNVKHQLHLNFWKLDHKNTLDIGLKFPKTQKGVKVFCFIENEQYKFDLEDLATTLHINEKVRYAVFNDVISISSCSRSIKSRHEIDTKSELITDREQEYDKFCLVDIDEFKQTQCASGTIIEIDIAGCTKECCKYYYIRFRVTGSWVENILKREATKPTRLAHYTTIMNVLDLRVNTVRTLPSQIVTRMNNDYNRFSKIQCFLMCKSSDELSLAMAPHKSVRVLEKEPWSHYIDTIKNIDEKSDILAYQWKEENSKDFLLFLKILTYEGFIAKAIGVLGLAGFISWGIATFIDYILQEITKTPS